MKTVITLGFSSEIKVTIGYHGGINSQLSGSMLSTDTSPPAHKESLNLEPQLIAHQNKQFWTLQYSGWFGYLLVVFMAIVRPQFSNPGFNLSGELINLAIETASGFSLSFLQWLLIRAIVHMPLRKTLAISFVSAGIMGLLFNIIKLASYKTIVYHQVWYEQLDMLEFGGWFLFSLTTMFVWTAIFFIMLYNTRLQREHDRLLRAENAAKEAQLQMLRYQLNPHFMFNTMNAISTLIYKKENQKASEMLDRLCSFFRYTLDQNASPESTLNKEIKLLELYLSIEKVRFGDKLSVKLQVPQATLTAKVPSLFLQPIVENAIKYGVETRKDNGLVTISAAIFFKNNSNYLRLEVIDNGKYQSVERNPGFGIGLKNTRERLATLFNNDFQLNISHSQTGTNVVMEVPFEPQLS